MLILSQIFGKVYVSTYLNYEVIILNKSKMYILLYIIKKIDIWDICNRYLVSWIFGVFLIFKYLLFSCNILKVIIPT